MQRGSRCGDRVDVAECEIGECDLQLRQQRDVSTEVVLVGQRGHLDRDLLPLGAPTRAASARRCERGAPSRAAPDRRAAAPASTASRLALSRRAPSAVCMSSVPSAPSVSTRSGRVVGRHRVERGLEQRDELVIDRRVGLVRPDARVVQRGGRRTDRLPVAEAEGEVRSRSTTALPRLAHLVGPLAGRTQATRARRAGREGRRDRCARSSRRRSPNGVPPLSARHAQTASRAARRRGIDRSERGIVNDAPAAAWVAISAAWSSSG